MNCNNNTHCLCAILCPILVYGMLYLYYVVAFGGLPYIKTTPFRFLCWFVITSAIAGFGFYSSVLLVYKSQIAKYCLITLITTNTISFGISVCGVIAFISFILGFHKY